MPAEAPETYPRNLVTSPRPRRRVLIADNSPDLVAVLGEIIRMDGSFEFVGHVSTGAAAVARVRSETIDVLLLDLGLEDCHGFDVLDQLVAAGAVTKVIVHTGHSSGEMKAAAKSRGAVAYVVKSGSVEELLAAIHAA
jgi:DNA-binding NarL/FixJ family response regulator